MITNVRRGLVVDLAGVGFWIWRDDDTCHSLWHQIFFKLLLYIIVSPIVDIPALDAKCSVAPECAICPAVCLSLQ